MTSSEYDSSADERFERLLIDSAASDAVPSNVDAAWLKFDAALRGVSLLAAGAGGAVAARRAQRWLAAKWLIWGALAGSALTALSVRPNHDPRVEASPTHSAPSALPTLTSNAPTPRTEVQEQQPSGVTPTTASTPSTTKARVRPIHPGARTSNSAAAPALSSAASSVVAPALSSTLAAQVALLDAARSAYAAGTFAEALRLADRYRADFPNGELAPEAEVVAIEALVARSDRQAASERAARFLARYPGDPHAARVKWLVR